MTDPGPIQPDDNAACVMLLREALARAEAGGTIAVAIAEVRAGGLESYSFKAGRSWTLLVGAVTMLQYHITRMKP